MGKIKSEIKPHSHRLFLKSFIITSAGCISILLLCLIDYLLTGEEITFSLLYLIPVGITVWFAGITGGVITSVLSTLTWFFIYINGKGPAEITAAIIINFILKLCLYLGFSYLLFHLKLNLTLEKKLSGTDPLTNAMNRRAFFNILKSEIARSSRYGHPVSLVYFDIDNFKKINDKYGHAEGDRLLKKISETAKSSLRNTDFLARMGGDEFAVLLSETDYADACQAVKSLYEDLNNMADKSKLQCSFSIGMVTYADPPKNPGRIVGKADELMYYSKKHGKNRITSENYRSEKKPTNDDHFGIKE